MRAKWPGYRRPPQTPLDQHLAFWLILITTLLAGLLFCYYGVVTIYGQTAAQVATVPIRPDPILTPGVSRPLTEQQVCGTKWGKDARHVTEAMKRQIAAAYHIPRASIVGYGKGPCCEFDHLISRELSGADDVQNIYPQQWDAAKKKDRLENKLNGLVCSGAMPLATAQQKIAADWVALYTQVFGSDALSVAK